MATGSKRRGWGLWRRRAKAKRAASEPKPVQNEKPPSEVIIKKGIYLSALIYIEGEQAAPANFDPVAVDALKKKLQSAFNEEADLRMTLKKIEIQNDVEEEEAEGEEKFQF